MRCRAPWCVGLAVLAFAWRGHAQTSPTATFHLDEGVRVREVEIGHHVGPRNSGRTFVESRCSAFPCTVPILEGTQYAILDGDDGSTSVPLHRGYDSLAVQIHRAPGLRWVIPLIVTGAVLAVGGGVTTAIGAGLSSPQRESPLEVGGLVAIGMFPLPILAAVILNGRAWDGRVTVTHVTIAPVDGGASAVVAFRF